MANSLLNQIFYNSNKFDIEPSICEKFMLLRDYVNAIKPIEEITNDIEERKEEKEVIKETSQPQLFIPKVNDKLFCSIYVLSIGYSEFRMIGNRYKNVELQEKQNIMLYIQKNKKHIKTTAQTNGVKLTNIKMQNIESELMTDTKTTWYTFWALCMYYKINALIVQNSVYMEFNVDSVYDTYLFERNDDFQMSVDFTKPTKTKLSEIKVKKLKIDPFIEKILRGVSSYKTPELIEMMTLLNLHCDTDKPKKNDYYDVIIKKLVSMHIQN
jgi:hypothetical protein